MMPYGRPRRRREESKAATYDPIAMTLAIWLGLVVSITTMGRLAQDAQAQADMRSNPVQTLTQLRQFPQSVPTGS